MSNKRRKFVSIVALILVGTMLLGLCGSIILAFAADSDSIQSEIDDLQAQADRIAEEKAKLQSEIDDHRSEAKSVVERKSEIDRSVELTREEVANIEAQMQEFNRLIAAKQEELDNLTEQEAERTSQYKIRLRAMEENGTKVSYWEILFGSSNFSDLLSRMEMIREIEDSDRRMLQNLKQSAQKVAVSREELAAQKVALAEKREELASAQETLDAQRLEADAVLQELASNISNMEDEIYAYEAKEDDLVEQIAQKEKEYKDALDAEEEARRQQEEQNGSSSSGGFVSESGFMAPLPYVYVTCAYGYRIHPITGNPSFHTGVDLGADQGTPIYASKSGVVTTSTYSDVYGYYVTINHGDGFATLYGHMTHYTVYEGQYVSQGEIIGYVGSTGWSTGPHLHFTIYYNGSTVNPMDYI